MNDKDSKAVNIIRGLAIDMISEAKSGHPGIALGAAPIIYTLYANHLKFSTVDENWVNRDRFILSAGHGSSLLYSMLHCAGYNISIDDLKKFRKIDSKTPGHPELGITSGVDMTTGPLGQGIATAVGIALGERYLSNLLNKYIKNQKMLDYHTYVLCGDGDLMEGISYEACSFAGVQKLGKLIVLYDSNDVCLDSETGVTFKEDVLKRFEAMGWDVQRVSNGENLNEIDRAIKKAKEVLDKPSIIEVKTIIGFGSINAGKNIVHGKPLDDQDRQTLKQKLGLPNTLFTYDNNVIDYLRRKINDRMNKYYTSWANYYHEVEKMDYELINNFLDSIVKNNFKVDLADLNNISLEKEELRISNYRVMNRIASKTPYIIGGSADLSSSCKTFLNYEGDVVCNSHNPLGKNIYFGVREHAMGAILNGLALSGLHPFGSTFLSFADYLKPAMRMSALMNLPVTYIFTHDSISIGEDGATHEPIEQLTMLRSIPNMTVYRPCDIREIIGCWDSILREQKPASLIISKSPVDVLENSNSVNVSKGAYIIRKEQNKLDGIIVATGTEVQTAYLIANELFKENLDIRVVSMPSMEIFAKQNEEYQNTILADCPIIALEAGSPMSWYKWTKKDYVLGLDSFGHSGSKDEVLKKMDFDFIKLKEKITILLR